MVVPGDSQEERSKNMNLSRTVFSCNFRRATDRRFVNNSQTMGESGGKGT